MTSPPTTPSPRVVVPRSGTSRGDTARSVAAGNGGEVVKGWTEGLHLIRRRVAAQRAAATIEEASEVERLMARTAELEAELEAARTAQVGADPTMGDALRALALACDRAEQRRMAAEERCEQLRSAAATRPAVSAPADVLRKLAAAIAEAEADVDEASDAVGTRPAYERRLHKAALRADSRVNEANRVLVWSGHIGRGAAIASFGLSLMLFGSQRTSLEWAAFIAVVVTALALLAWVTARLQLRRETKRRTELMFRAGVDDLDELAVLSDEFDEWEARDATLARANERLGIAMSAWDDVAPGTEPAEVVALADAAHRHDYALAALPAAERSFETAQRRADVTRGRWLAETARLHLTGEPRDVESMVTELERRAAEADPVAVGETMEATADELRRLLHGRPPQRLLDEAASVGDGFAPHELDNARRPVVIEVDETLPSRRQRQEAIDELRRRGATVDVTIVTDDREAASWGFPVVEPTEATATALG